MKSSYSACLFNVTLVVYNQRNSSAGRNSTELHVFNLRVGRWKVISNSGFFLYLMYSRVESMSLFDIKMKILPSPTQDCMKLTSELLPIIFSPRLHLITLCGLMSSAAGSVGREGRTKRVGVKWVKQGTNMT